MFSNNGDQSDYDVLPGKRNVSNQSKKSSLALSLFGKKKQTVVTPGVEVSHPASAESLKATEFKTVGTEKNSETSSLKVTLFKKDNVNTDSGYRAMDDSLQIYIADQYKKTGFFELIIDGTKYKHAYGEMTKDASGEFRMSFISADMQAGQKLLTRQEFEAMAADKFEASQGKCLVM